MPHAQLARDDQRVTVLAAVLRSTAMWPDNVLYLYRAGMEEVFDAVLADPKQGHVKLYAPNHPTFHIFISSQFV